MKAKTKYQRHIVELSEKLPKAPGRFQDKAILYCFDPLFTTKYSSYVCLECGNKWKNKIKPDIKNKAVCPFCGKSLKHHSMDNRCDKICFYAGIITSIEDFQVFRIYMVSKYLNKGKAATYDCREVIQHWIAPNGKRNMMTVQNSGWSYNLDLWYSGSGMELRAPSYRLRFIENIFPYYVYDKRKVTTEIKRRGFKGGIYSIRPQSLFIELLTNPKAETLLKAKQHELLKEAVYMKYRVDQYWPAIKICLRNKYLVKDASMYFDYLDLLSYFEKDLRNKKFVCPDNLKKEHDLLMCKKQRILNREDREREKQRKEKSTKRKMLADFFKQDSTNYQIFRKQFLDLTFEFEDIIIKPLQSIDEFKFEAEKLNHCVYSNGYYLKEDSLILSARINNEPIETIEVSLSRMELIQARGDNNDPSKYHNKIIDLMNKNMKQIARRNAKQSSEFQITS